MPPSPTTSTSSFMAISSEARSSAEQTRYGSSRWRPPGTGRYRAQNTSLRLASIAAAISRSVWRTGNASRSGLQPPVVLAVTPLEAHLEEVRGQGRRGHVAPLDERDPVLHQLGQAEVDHLLQMVEAVHVGMDEPDASDVAAHERERGAHDRLGDAERPPEALGEGGLARAQASGQEHDVAEAGARCDLPVLLVGGPGRCVRRLTPRPSP